MTPEEEALFEKDVTEVTPADMERMMHILEEGEKDMQQALKDLNAAAAEVAKSAINSAAAEVMETLAADGARDGANAAILALNEYSKTYKGSVHDFFTDPNLPEVLARIRDRANEILLELAGNDGKNIFIETKKPRPIRADTVEFPIDKINNKIWNLLENETTTKDGMPGQIVFDLAGSPKKNVPAKAPVYYSINFDELDKDEALKGITRRLTPTDKRVYIAISALYNAGNTSMSYTQIYYATGRTGKPGKHDREIIEKSILKMMSALVSINDEKAAAQLGEKAYPIITNLLPAIYKPTEGSERRLKGEEKGTLILRMEPPLVSYAKRRNQITTLPMKLLQAPINKNDAGIALEDYLLDRIAHEKHMKHSNFKIKYDTICERIRQTERKQRERTPEKVIKLLKFYEECAHIKRFTEHEDGVTVILAN